MIFRWSWRSSEAGILISANRPNPVLTPYITLPDSTEDSMIALASSTFFLASFASSTLTSPFTIFSAVSMVRLCPSMTILFLGSVTGDLQATLSGTAVFGTASVGGNDGFVIAFQRGSVSAFDLDLILLGRFNAQRPGVGTYDIIESGCSNCGDDDFDGGYVLQRPDGASGIFVSEAGQLTITKSTADTVAGNCSFTAHDFTNAASQITITASFTAVVGEVPTVPGG